MNKYVAKYVNRDKRLSRGIRNNNPGNIRCGSTRWLGLSHFQNDSEFCQFQSLEYGIRALVVLLRTYYNKYHCNTIEKIITRYAPSNENNTEAYIKFVSNFIDYPCDCELKLRDVLQVACAIMKFESNFVFSPLLIALLNKKFNIV